MSSGPTRSWTACNRNTVAPGIEINRLTDVALKATNVKPGLQVIERFFGVLEVHSPDQAEVRAAGEAILEGIEHSEDDRLKPRIISSQIIRRIDDYHAQLINRTRHGEMIIPGQTLYVLECEPAAYASLAANEAEKSAEINVLEVRSFGSMGRVYLGGEEQDIDVGWQAAVSALEGLTGRDPERCHGQSGQGGAGEYGENRRRVHNCGSPG